MDPATESLLTRAADLERELSDIRRALAGVPQETRDGHSVGVLVCRSGEARFAVPVEQVDEVVPNAALSALPGTDSWILGAVNVEGALVPVLDVGVRLGATPFRSTADDALVLCRSMGRRVALCATEVPSLLQVDRAALLPTPANQPDAPYVAATVRVDVESIPLLSVVGLSLAGGLLSEST